MRVNYTTGLWLACVVGMLIPSSLFAREGKPFAHWPFDQADGKILPNAIDATFHATARSKMRRTAGVFGRAAYFSDNAVVSLPGTMIPENLRRISFSVWVKPDRFDRYNELFRQEVGEKRILFSFQNEGTVLALGLNAGGRYAECDAAITPEMVLDGEWHHCGATFDGSHMRVYLDGAEIGSLKHEGELITTSNGVCYIGSSRGTSEFFHGAMDDLRIFDDCLSEDEMVAIFLKGNTAIAQSFKEASRQWAKVYVEKETFSGTLAAIRARVRETSFDLSNSMEKVASRSLRADFPKEYSRFKKHLKMKPSDYFMLADPSSVMEQAREILERYAEYMPITEQQWARLTPEEDRKWKKARKLKQEMEKRLTQGDATLDANWLEPILRLAEQIEERPVEREAVAPYRTPSTPETKDYSSAEAEQILRKDWLHQAGGTPSPERILQEIQWAEELADRIVGDYPERVDFSRQLGELGELEEKAESLTESNAELYFDVRRVKRSIMLSNPVLDFDSVLFVDMPFPHGKEWRHETRHRLGYMAVPGGRLMTLQGLSPAGHLVQLMPKAPLHGSFWRPDLSFDGERVVFCFKPHNEKAFHLYECNIDGSNARQLTSGIFDDLDPIYLPDGEHIAFTTTRGHTYVRCMPPTNAFILARMKLDGTDLYLISRNNEPDYTPSVLNDGRILFTRWEYTDKPLWRAQSLWTMNPDGTQVNTFWGNQSVWPDLLKDARAIPNSGRVMFTGSAHHDWFSGSVGIIDPRKGFNFPDGLTKVTTDMPWPESGNGPVDPVESSDYHPSGRYSGYYSPYPLNETDFLVSASRAGDGVASKFVLYLMDVDGNRELIHEGTHNIFHAQPVRPRRLPPRIPDRVAWPTREERGKPRDGIITSNDVYDNAPDEMRGKAKYLRVLNIEPKTYTYWNQRPYASTGPVVSMVQSEGVKRVLGTVPVEADGSVSFYTPSGIALHFQLLDEKHRALQTMRSFTGVMPGERRGCLGCHESHSTTPPLQPQGLALHRQPSQITPPPWSDNSVSYERYVQPVLDQYCGECHQGDGEARETLDLTLRPGYNVFKEPYVTLIGRPSWGSPYEPPENPPPGFGIADTLIVEGYDRRDPAAYTTPKPMTRLSYKSRLVDLCSSGEHHDVEVDPVNLRRIQVWIDTMCPYRGAEEVRAIDDPVFQGVDWISIRPRVKTAPTLRRPGPFDPFELDEAYDAPQSFGRD
ncbi:MAG: LamG-like jellyroll fold domain-containing protein [Planctomycetota bacterium]